MRLLPIALVLGFGLATFSTSVSGQRADDQITPLSVAYQSRGEALTAQRQYPAATDAPAGTESPTDTAGAGDVPEGAMTELGEGEGAVNLIAWAGYVEDGSTDPNVDWVSSFEDETGCEVSVRLGNSSDEMVQLMQSGEYDGVVDFDAAVRDPANPRAMLAIYDSGDTLHPNSAGYAAMANAVDLTLLSTTKLRRGVL